MRKTWLFALFAIILVFTACKPVATPTKTASLMECTISPSVFPTPKAESEKVYAPITASDWTKGPENALMTIIEYSDFT